MSRILKRKQCRWVSATNADNVYGSNVVDRVLKAPPHPTSKKTPDMLLNPIDSRNFMWSGRYNMLSAIVVMIVIIVDNYGTYMFTVVLVITL